MEKINRADRDAESREMEKRPEPWKPASLLPTPRPLPGIRFRWIRISTLGQSDLKNVSSRFRERWTPVNKADHPELEVLSDKNTEWPDGIQIGGLLLCKTAAELVDQRSAYFNKRSQDQLSAIDTDVLRYSNPLMPMARPERRTNVTRGRPVGE